MTNKFLHSVPDKVFFFSIEETDLIFSRNALILELSEEIFFEINISICSNMLNQFMQNNGFLKIRFIFVPLQLKKSNLIINHDGLPKANPIIFFFPRIKFLITYWPHETLDPFQTVSMLPLFIFKRTGSYFSSSVFL